MSPVSRGWIGGGAVSSVAFYNQMYMIVNAQTCGDSTNLSCDMDILYFIYILCIMYYVAPLQLPPQSPRRAILPPALSAPAQHICRIRVA